MLRGEHSYGAWRLCIICHIVQAVILSSQLSNCKKPPCAKACTAKGFLNLSFHQYHLSSMDSELPPPAYSEADFDQKISTALEISLNISPSQNAEEEEEWEQWDESVYQAAISGSSTSRSPTSSETAGASSSRTLPPPPAKNGKSPSNPPLTRPSEKALSRSSTNSQASKQRPSWYAEAGLDDSSSSSGAGSSSAGPSSPSSYTSASQSQPSSGFIIHNIPDEEEEDRSIPPPPFTAVGPSLDGPPFEEVEVTLSYQADESGPPSPLTSPQLPTALPAAYPTFTATTPQPSSPPQQHRPQPDFSANHHRQSLPVPPLAVPHRVSPRPTTTYGPIHTQSSGVPQVGFNASVAYNKRGGIPEQHTTQQPVQVIDAAAFYKYVVIPH